MQAGGSLRDPLRHPLKYPPKPLKTSQACCPTAVATLSFSEIALRAKGTLLSEPRFSTPPARCDFSHARKGNGLFKEKPSTKAIFPFSRGKICISQGVENRGSLISVPLALRVITDTFILLLNSFSNNYTGRLLHRAFWQELFLCNCQKNSRVRKIPVRNSGAGNGCANFMDASNFCVLSAGKPPCP